MNNVHCNGDEDSLFNCTYNSDPCTQYSTRAQTAHVVCSMDPISEGEIDSRMDLKMLSYDARVRHISIMYSQAIRFP